MKTAQVANFYSIETRAKQQQGTGLNSSKKTTKYTSKNCALFSLWFLQLTMAVRMAYLQLYEQKNGCLGNYAASLLKRNAPYLLESLSLFLLILVLIVLSPNEWEN